MKRLWPLLLILGGVLIVFGGFIYDLMFAGWSPQDPTPEMSTSYVLQAGIASIIRWFGVAVFLVGWVAGIRRFWPLLPMFGGSLLAFGGLSFATAFAARPELADFVRIARIAFMLGWCGVVLFLFGVVAGVIRRVKRKPSVVS